MPELADLDAASPERPTLRSGALAAFDRLPASQNRGLALGVVGPGVPPPTGISGTHTQPRFGGAFLCADPDSIRARGGAT
jgi:hypothetical protein